MPSLLRISPNAIDCAIGLADTSNVSDAGTATNHDHEMPRSYVSRNAPSFSMNASRERRGSSTVPTAFALNATGML